MKNYNCDRCAVILGEFDITSICLHKLIKHLKVNIFPKTNFSAD